MSMFRKRLLTAVLAVVGLAAAARGADYQTEGVVKNLPVFTPGMAVKIPVCAG